MLAGVEVVVAAVESVEGLVGSALHDLALFDYENLVGSADGGEAVGDDEGGAALHEEVEAVLDHGFGLGVEGAGGLVEDEDPGIGEDGAGDGDALALTAGELDAALAYDGVVLLGETLGELVDAGDTAGVDQLLFGGVGAAEEDVLADGAVEEEGLLKDYAELLAVAAEADGGEVDAVDEDLAASGGVEAADERDDGGLTRAGRAYEGGDGAGSGVEADAVKDGLAGVVGEGDVLEGDVAADGGEIVSSGWLGVFFLMGHDFHGAVESGDTFGELGADGDELNDGGDHKGEEHDVGDVTAGGEFACYDLVGAEVHDEGADYAEDGGGCQGHERLGGERRDDVLEEAVGAGGEDFGLAGLGVVALDDADAAKGFGEAAGDLGVDLGALAEDGADGLEGALEDEAKEEEDDEGDERHLNAEFDEIDEGEDGGENAAEEVDDAGSDEVTDTFDVGHDAGDEGAGAVLVVESYGQAADVGLDFHAEFGDESLTGFGEELGEGEGGYALKDGRRDDDTNDDWEQAKLVLTHDVIDEVFRGSWQNQTTCTIYDHQQKASAEEQAAGFNQLPDLGQNLLQLRLRTRGSEIGGGCAAGAAGGAICGFHAGSAEGVAERRHVL